MSSISNPTLPRPMTPHILGDDTDLQIILAQQFFAEDEQGDAPTPPSKVPYGQAKPLKKTPPLRAIVRRQSSMKNRIEEHRFHEQFAIAICAVSHRSSSFAGLVEVCHMLSFASKDDELRIWEWALGYPAGTLNVDTRINGMFLWVDIHKLADYHLLLILPGRYEIDLTAKEYSKNASLPSDKKKLVPLELDKLMPSVGWTYNAMLCRQDGFEVIHRHNLGRDNLNKKIPIPECSHHPAPCRITFNSATSPIFVLANIYERSQHVNLADLPHWNEEEKLRLSDCLMLLEQITRAVIPSDFLPSERREGLRGNITKSQANVERAAYREVYDYRTSDLISPDSRPRTPDGRAPLEDEDDDDYGPAESSPLALRGQDNSLGDVEMDMGDVLLSSVDSNMSL